jgi:hypothetical protein
VFLWADDGEDKELVHMFRFFLAAFLALLIAGPVFAQAPQTQPAPAAQVPPPAAMPAAPSTPMPAAKDTPAVVTGKVMVKEVPLSGKPVKVPYIQVQDAKGPENEQIQNVRGAMLKVTGPKVALVEKYDGQTVEAKGVVKGGNMIEVGSVTVKEAAKPAQSPSPGPQAQAK